MFLSFENLLIVDQDIPSCAPSQDSLLFADDAYFKRFGHEGTLLPNPRVLSLMLRELPEKLPTDHNVMVMQLGQFVDHDLVITKSAKG